MSALIKRQLRNCRRGQLAFEHIFTYSLVFLTVMSLATILYIYGSSESKNIFPPTCEFLSGITCLDSVVDTLPNSTNSTIIFQIRNEMGFDIGNISIKIEGTCDSEIFFNVSTPWGKSGLLNLESGTYQMPCDDLYKKKVDERITITFKNVETDQSHRKTGSLKYVP